MLLSNILEWLLAQLIQIMTYQRARVLSAEEVHFGTMIVMIRTHWESMELQGSKEFSGRDGK